MLRDPIVEEVRRIREGYAKRLNYDVMAITEDLKRLQREARPGIGNVARQEGVRASPCRLNRQDFPQFGIRGQGR